MKWLKENIFVKDMFIYLFIATIIFYTPTWVSALYGMITGNNLLYGISTAWVLIWAGPFTPTIPIIFAIALFLKGIVNRITGKKDEE